MLASGLARAAKARLHRTSAVKVPSFALALLVCLAPSVRAQSSDRPFTVTITPSYVSEYMYRGTQLAGSSLQPAIEADAGQAVFGVWSNLPLASTGSVRATEVDPYASYSIPLGKEFSLAPGFEAYTYSQPSPAEGNYRARYEPNLSLTYSAHGIRVTPTAYYDLTLQELTLELTVTTALPLAAIGTELDLTGTAGNYTATHALDTSGPNEKAWGSYWLLGGSIPYQLVKNVKAAIGYAYTDGFDAHTQLGSLLRVVNPRAVGRSVLSASVTLSF